MPKRLLISTVVCILAAALGLGWWFSSPPAPPPISPAERAVAVEAPTSRLALPSAAEPPLPITPINKGANFAVELPSEEHNHNTHFHNPAKQVRTVFPRSFSRPVEVESGSARVNATPLNAHAESTGTVGADGTLVYANAFDGCDVAYRCAEFKTEEFIVVKDAAAQTRWSWDLETHGLQPRLTPAHTLELCDAAGVPRLRINTPVGKDAAGKALNVGERLTLDLEGNRLTLAARLDGCEFPVVIDPTWSNTGTMAALRYQHAAILLKTGKVLACLSQDPSCELFDPVTETWSSTGSLAGYHFGDTATLLNDGSVLVAGQSCERYNPNTGTWSPTGSLNNSRVNNSAVLLDNGTVLVAGGLVNNAASTSCEIYDPSTGVWTPTASLSAPVYSAPIVRLAGGEILEAGGQAPTGNGATSQASLFDQNSYTWTTGGIPTGVFGLTVTALPDGSALTVGGQYSFSASTYCYFYSPNGVSGTSPLLPGRFNHASVLLKNGAVLSTGGETINTGFVVLANCDLFNTANKTWSPTASLLTARHSHTATVLPNGTVLITGGNSNFLILNTCEIFDPSTLPTLSEGASPTVILEGQTVSLGSTVTNPDSVTLAYLWDFGDGTSSTDPNPTHAYATAGVYNPKVAITGNTLVGRPFGIQATPVTITVYRNADRPTANFSVSALTGYVGQRVGFDASFNNDPFNTITSYTWNFGDGSPLGSGPLIYRVFTTPGTYTVSLTVTSAAGLSDTTSQTFVVLPADQAGLFSSNFAYSVSWNRASTNADSLKFNATINLGGATVAANAPLSLTIAGQTFTGTAAAKSSLRKAGTTTSGPQVSFELKPVTAKGAPKGIYTVSCTVKKATLGQAFALAGVTGIKSATAKIPIRLTVGSNSFAAYITSQFRIGSNGLKASGGGQGPQ